MQKCPLHVLGEAVLIGDGAGAHDAGSTRRFCFTSSSSAGRGAQTAIIE
jgi:hypothetical protein